MIINQRDVVDVNFRFPDGSIKAHPVIVLSMPNVLSCEGTFIGVPISHSAEYNDNEFSFPLFDSDFDKPLKYGDSHARMHLITVIHKADIVTGTRVLRTMEKDSFYRLFDEIQTMVFGCE